jgi:hypothetical protein
MGYRVMPLDYGVRSHAAAATPTPETSGGSSRDWGGGSRVYADGWNPENNDPMSFDAERYVQKRLEEESSGWEDMDDEFRSDENVHWT